MEIDGEYYWDGGLMSNTPLYEVVQDHARVATRSRSRSICGARSGPVPDNIVDVQGRMKDMQYSSRTRLVTDMLQRSQRFRHVLREVLDHVPEEPEHRDDPWCKLAEELSCSKRYNVIHLIYRQKEYEGHFKDFQFGLVDHARTLGKRFDRYPGIARATGTGSTMPNNESGFITHDIHRDTR